MRSPSKSKGKLVLDDSESVYMSIYISKIKQMFLTKLSKHHGIRRNRLIWDAVEQVYGSLWNSFLLEEIGNQKQIEKKTRLKSKDTQTSTHDILK